MSKRKVSNELIHIAYDLCKKVFEGRLTSEAAQKELIGDDRMNSTTAKDYIENFINLKNGDDFIRDINAYSAEYYLANIYKDYGSIQLATSLSTLRLYMNFNENHKKTTMHKMRAVCDKYSAILLKTTDKPESKA